MTILERWVHRAGGLGLAFAAAAAAAGCGGGQSPAEVVATAGGGWRMIAEHPHAEPTVGPFLPSTELGPQLGRHAFGGETQAWSVEGADFRVDGDGLEIRQAEPVARLVRAVDIDATQTCVVVVEGSALRGSRPDLYWARRTPGGLDWHGMAPTTDERVEGGRRLLYRVGDRPTWRGRIARIRIELSGGRRPTLEGLAWHGCLPPEREQILDLARRPRRVRVAGELRPAVLVARGVEQEWALNVPAGGELRFSAAVLHPHVAAGPGRVALEVVALGADGRVAGLERTFEVAPGAWQEFHVPLPAIVGRDLRLRFRSRSADEGVAAVAVAEARVSAPAAAGPRPSPDLVLISLDTVSAARLKLYGYSTSTMPGLEQWARRHALVFGNAWSAAGATLASHSAMMSGLDPLRPGMPGLGHDPIAPSVELVAQRLRTSGYRTVAVTDGGYVDPSFGFDRGFDRYGWMYDSLAEQVRAASSVLDEAAGQPLFLFFHTYAAHAPYEYFGRLPQAARCHVPGHQLTAKEDHANRRYGVAWQPPGAGLPAPEGCVGPLYDDGLAELDRHLAPLLERLSSGERRRFVVVTADHGEALGGGGRFGHGWPHPDVSRVPLLVSGPRIDPALTQRWACGPDVAATLLGRAGLSVPAGFDGRDLLAVPAPRPRPCTYLVHRPRAAVARHEPGGRTVVVEREDPSITTAAAPPFRAWAFHHGRDPHARRAWAVSRDDAAWRAVEQALASPERAAQGAHEGPSPELLDRLRALGYVQ